MNATLRLSGKMVECSMNNDGEDDVTGNSGLFQNFERFTRANQERIAQEMDFEDSDDLLNTIGATFEDLNHGFFETTDETSLTIDVIKEREYARGFITVNVIIHNRLSFVRVPAYIDGKYIAWVAVETIENDLC